MEIQLVVTSGVHAGRVIVVHHAEFVIGRTPECQLRIGSDLVSRRHCLICRERNRVFVKDLGSTNGTLVNDAPLTQTQQLQTGDRVQVGPMEFEVVLGVFNTADRQLRPPATQDTMANSTATTRNGTGSFHECKQDSLAMRIDTPANDAVRKSGGQPTTDHADNDSADISAWLHDDSEASPINAAEDDAAAAATREEPLAKPAADMRAAKKQRDNNNVAATTKNTAADVLSRMSRFLVRRK